jgi:Predicted glycosyltransferases
MPAERDPDLLPLYADAETWATIAGNAVRVSETSHIDHVLSRTSMRVPAGTRISFASYFNAFPAAYWQHSTNVRSVRLTVRTEGPGTVLVFRSTSQGIPQRVAAHDVDGAATTEVELPVTGFGDGGWYWFDIVAGKKPVALLGGEWSTEQPAERIGRVSLGITTYNKPDYCVATLGTLAGSPELLAEIDRIFVIDQGTRKVADEPGFEELAAALGDKLQILYQGNLGGSGGFSRSMAETLDRPESDFVLLLDDDVKVEPESILRALRFGRQTRKPTLVGGHMFDLLDRPVMHAFAEIVDMKPFIWKATFKDDVPHDFRTSNLRQTRWMHARMDVDYNGWWFCLIPTQVVRDTGLALPAFIKWDDAEYCLRAREHGYPTVTFPGAALWHISWLDKDDTLDWQAYFHTRNRFVAALLHSPFERGGLILRDSKRWDLKHLLGMQYYPVTLRHRALRDVLSGPAHMHAGIGSILGELNAQAKNFPEKRVLRTDAELPPANRGKQVYPVLPNTQFAKGPTGVPLVIFTLKMMARQWFTKPSRANVDRPEVELSKRDATWFRLPYFDSVLVSTADGSGKNWYTRNPRMFRRMLTESIRLHREIGRNWERLAREYREALPTITSPEEWRKTFEK